MDKRNVAFHHGQSKNPQSRQVPKLMACMSKISLENFRNKAIYALDLLDRKAIRRRKIPLHQCLVLELREAGFRDSSDYLRDLIYDNEQILAEDEIGLVVDLRKRDNYMFEVCKGLQKAEKEHEKGHTKEESIEFLMLAQNFAQKEKGIFWLSEKLFLASIAVSSRYILDGGRQKAVCKYFYAKFLLDKFPGLDPEEEAFILLTDVRDASTGKPWKLYEPRESDPKYKVIPKDTVFGATALQLHRVLLSKSRMLRQDDIAKSERLARLAVRRAYDANDTTKISEAILEVGICQVIMNNLNNARKTFMRSLKLYAENNDIEGICNTKMHMASIYHKLRDFEHAARLLTEMGAIAMMTGLRLHLGRSLNLLGELHLRRNKPELGTQFLAEAFSCFTGHLVTEVELDDNEASSLLIRDLHTSELDVLYEENKKDKSVYTEEAEQSRLMMAVSAGQEIMASYVRLMKKADWCTIAHLQVIEWKMNGAAWWINRIHHDLTPCMCKEHKRTPLDVVKYKLTLNKSQSTKSVYSSFSLHYADLGRVVTTHDIRNLRRSFHDKNEEGMKDDLKKERKDEKIANEEVFTTSKDSLKSQEGMALKQQDSGISRAISEGLFDKKSRVFIKESQIFR